MASSHDLKELALALAEHGFGSRVGMMVDAAAGDARALSDAAISLPSSTIRMDFGPSDVIVEPAGGQPPTAVATSP